TVIHDPGCAERLGRGGLARVQRFTASSVAERVEGVYQRVAERPQPGPRSTRPLSRPARPPTRTPTTWLGRWWAVLVAAGLFVHAVGMAFARGSHEVAANWCFYAGALTIYGVTAQQLLAREASRLHRVRVAVAGSLAVLGSFVLFSPLRPVRFDE